MDSIRSLTLEELNREALQRFVEDYQVDQAMIRYLADAAFNVIQCDPTMMPPPATDANRSRYPSPPRSPPARAVRCEDGGLPSLEEFITQLVVSSRVHVATLMPTLVYLNRLKSRLQPMAKGLRCTTHRIFLAALILTAKYLNDSSPKNKHWASYSVITNAAFQFGFSNTEVNLMEKQLLFLLDWDLGVSEEDLYRELDYFLAPIRRKIEAKHHREMRRLAEELQREADMEAEKQRMETRRRQAEKRLRQPEDENDYTFVAAAVSYKTPPPSRGSSRSRSRHASPDSVRDDMPGLYSSSSSYAGSTTSRATTPITDAPADPYTGIYEEVYGSPVVIEAPPVPEKGPNYTIDYCAVPTTRKKLYREIIEDPRSMEDGGRAKRMRGGLRMLERVFGTANGPAGVVVR